MRLAVWLALCVSLTGCDALGIKPAKQLGLVGEWGWMDGQSEFPKECGSDGTIQYLPNGEYRLWGESGTWRLEQNVLTEAMTDFDPLHVDRSVDDIGKEYLTTVRWIDQNIFSKRMPDGSELAFRRCPRPH